MQDKTICNAKLVVRKKVIPANGDGLSYVETRMMWRGVRLIYLCQR